MRDTAVETGVHDCLITSQFAQSNTANSSFEEQLSRTEYDYLNGGLWF